MDKPVAEPIGACAGAVLPLLAGDIINASAVATFALNLQHEVVHWNPACEALTGVKANEVLGTRTPWRAFYSQQRPVLADLILEAQGAEALERLYGPRAWPSRLIAGAFDAEDYFSSMGAAGRWLAFTAAPVRNAQGELCGAVETVQDITEQRRAETALRESQNALALIVDACSVPMFVIDAEHRVTHWNRACEALTGMRAHDVIGTDQQWRAFYDQPRPVLADIVLNGASDDAVAAFYGSKMFRPSKLLPGAYEAEDFFPAFGDNGRWVYFTAAPIRNAAGQVVGAIETLQDASARKAAETALRDSEERYRLFSQQDHLTQLFNARHLHDQLAREIERASRYARPLSLLLLDADRFKQINDTWGHQVGDQVLQALAQTLRETLRNTDSGYRYGGEEFVALMPETHPFAAMAVAERLRQRVAALALPLPGHEHLCFTISVGVAGLLDEDDGAALLRRADQACYQAKALGRNRVQPAA